MNYAGAEILLRIAIPIRIMLQSLAGICEQIGALACTIPA